MSKSLIVSTLRSGSATNADLRAALSATHHQVTRWCHALIESGEIVRLDNMRGSGSRAVYGLPGEALLQRAFAGTREREDAIMDLWDQNLSAAQIAERLSLRPVSVQSILNYMRPGANEKAMSETVLARCSAEFLAALRRAYPNGCPA